jgi:hypothetical protein
MREERRWDRTLSRGEELSLSIIWEEGEGKAINFVHKLME